MRFPEIARVSMSDEQCEVAALLSDGPSKKISSPMNVLIRQPELARQSQELSEYFKTSSALSRPILELVVLITAWYWSEQTMWLSHSQKALLVGVRPEIVDAIAIGRRPVAMSPHEEAAYDFCMELTDKKRVGDSAFKAALAQFGESGVVELTCAAGFYSLAAMALVANNTTAVGGAVLSALPFIQADH